ncbi:MAG: 50S ribosomal protein L24 [Nanoarchaeota archaeon]|nr:50S ribosomal protein L24 [Nanoarchaeota archaeon]
MKKYSIKWRTSTRGSKQRKFKANAPSHIRHKMVSAHLSKELRTKYARRSFPLRKGDTVKIQKGKFSGKSGKVSEIDMRKFRAYVDGMTVSKKDGSKVNVPIVVSDLMIIEFNLDDKMRIDALGRNIKKPVETKNVSGVQRTGGSSA